MRLVQASKPQRFSRDSALQLIESIHDYAIFSMDPERRIIFWNPGAQEVFGYESEEILGKFADLLFTPEDRAEGVPLQEAEIALREGSAADERWHLCKDGSRFFASGRLMPMRERGKLQGFVKVARDITERKRFEGELQKAKDEAERANLAKSSFLANMSHEIRTPLCAILGFTDFVLDADTSSQEKLEAARIIKKNGDLLLKIINNVLDLSKMEAKQSEIERIPFSLRELIEEVVASFRLQAQEKGLFLETFYAQIPELILSDPTKIRQILMNVLGNAVKFTERGSVHLFVREAFRSGSSLSLNVMVKDTGIGMTPEQARKIFDPFVQADASLSRQYGGTGLGLPIASRLAELIGGQLLLLESGPGQGSTFDLLIIAELPDEKQGQAAKRPQAVGWEKPLHGLNILLAEDVPDNQILMRKRLQNLGAQVTLAANGQEAVEKALESSYDLILMDLQMPRLDGYQATERLRSKAYAGLIFALTAHAMSQEREKALRSGFDDYLTKPLDKDLLIKSLKRLL